jgi:glyoxylase-like metal-dependent hydrolase (beta-lactamase superfamily II)
MNIVNVGYDSTHYYGIDCRSGTLLVECGWPGTLLRLAALKRKGMSLKEVRHLPVRPFHPDHAGLVQELKLQGIRFIVLDCQPAFIASFADYFKTKKLPYIPITQDGNLILDLEDSRKFLALLGLEGEIHHTPGHDEGYAFAGDLHPSFMSIDDLWTQASRAKIHERKVRCLFLAHGG